jgi:hypothetical protein
MILYVLSDHSSDMVAHSVGQVSDERQMHLSLFMALFAHEWQIEEAVRWTFSIGSHPGV